MLNDSPISWESKRQPMVALSSTEAEYITLTQAAKKAIWLRRILADLGHPQASATTIYEDNQSTIKMTEQPGEHRRTKHIDIRHHFIREKVESNEIRVEYCPTAQQVADIMTKALPKDKYIAARDRLLHQN
jgi:hypothetical protein